MNAPAEFVVCRHLVSHPGEAVAGLAHHLGLHYGVAKSVIERLKAQEIQEPQDLVNHALRLPRRPDHQDRAFFLPNPEDWFREFSRPRLESGERVAADIDGLNLVPGRFLVYVAPGHAEEAYRVAIDNFGKIAAGRQANLVIRVADPWLHSDGGHPIVELGQRLLDYEESPNIRLARRLVPRG